MARIFGLEFKVIAVLGFLVVVAASTIAFMAYALEQSQANQPISDRLSSLQVLSQSVFRRSGNYIESAPRSYPDYNRDLIVYYPDFMSDLEGMGGIIEAVHQDYSQRAASLLLGGVHFGLRTAANDQAVDGMRDSWLRFRDGLHEQLGDDRKEPRLEWGTAFIRDNQRDLQTVIAQLIERLRGQLDQQVMLLQTASKLAMGVLAGLALLGLLWFYFGVTRRIRHAVAGCVRVSTGDFGFQMPARGRDEIGILGRAINTLSSRARLILVLIDRVRRAQDPADALYAVWDEGEQPFALSWIGLFEVRDGERRISLAQACPHDAGTHVRQLDLRTQHVLKDSLQLGEPRVFNDLQTFVQAHPSERLIRELARAVEDTQAIITLPLQHAGDVWGVLVLVSQAADAFSDEHVSLLRNISPLLSEALRRQAPSTPESGKTTAAAAGGTAG